MSLEKYGPPEREAQGRGLMKREKEGELTADAWRTQNAREEVGRTRGRGEKRREEKRGGRRRVIERERGRRDAGETERGWGRMEYGGEWRN